MFTFPSDFFNTYGFGCAAAYYVMHQTSWWKNGPATTPVDKDATAATIEAATVAATAATAAIAASAVPYESKLRLKAPDIDLFSGEPLTWCLWKSATQSTLFASGFESVLQTASAALADRPKNKIVYTLLEHATMKGYASHIVNTHRHTKDGYHVWTDLCTWYDGEDLSSDTAEIYRQHLQDTILCAGVKPSAYINSFLNYYNELLRIPGHAMHEDTAKALFVNNITDPSLTIEKTILSSSRRKSSLDELVKELRRHERQTDSETGRHKRIRRMFNSIPAIQTETPSQPSSKRRRVNDPSHTSTDRQQSLPSPVSPNLKGIIHVRPSELWSALKKDQRNWVLLYNRAVRHNESLPTPPTGITVGPQKDDGLDNVDVRTTRRVSSPVPSPPASDATAEDDITSIDESELFPPGVFPQKAVSFHLHKGHDDSSAAPKRRLRASDYFYSRPRRGHIRFHPTLDHPDDSDSDFDDMPNLYGPDANDSSDDDSDNDDDDPPAPGLQPRTYGADTDSDDDDTDDSNDDDDDAAANTTEDAVDDEDNAYASLIPQRPSTIPWYSTNDTERIWIYDAIKPTYLALISAHDNLTFLSRTLLQQRCYQDRLNPHELHSALGRLEYRRWNVPHPDTSTEHQTIWIDMVTRETTQASAIYTTSRNILLECTDDILSQRRQHKRQPRRVPRTYKLRSTSTTRRTTHVTPGQTIAVIDSGGGRRPTVTASAWTAVGGDTGITATLSPYQTTAQESHPVRSAMTKATITGRTDPVLLLVHYATFIESTDDHTNGESLLTTMDMGNHGVTINGIHPNDDQCGITVKGDFLPFDWDDEKLFFRIEKPTADDLTNNRFQVYEINSPAPPGVPRRKRSHLEFTFGKVPMSELRKRFAMLPETTVKHSLDNTTQYYTELEEENRDVPRRHFRKRFKGFHYRRQNESVSTDYTFLSSKTSQGHNGGQFFTGCTSKKWSFHPLKTESQCTAALQDYLREHGAPATMISDNAKSETGHPWTTILREHMVRTRTSEPHHPHQNPAEPEWGRLSKMVQNCLRVFNAPEELAHWCIKWCCQVNNVAARRSLGWKVPLEVSQG